MSGTEHTEVFRELSPEARTAARTLLAETRHGALATLAPEDGHPQATRVGLAALPDGTPLIFVSALSAHTTALRADPRCSLLVGDVGRGDPLAHARLTLKCRAAEIARRGTEHDDAREVYLAAHPKAQLYIDLPDFTFMRLVVESANFNAGFGRAYRLTVHDLGER